MVVQGRSEPLVIIILLYIRQNYLDTVTKFGKVFDISNEYKSLGRARKHVSRKAHPSRHWSELPQSRGSVAS